MRKTLNPAILSTVLAIGFVALAGATFQQGGTGMARCGGMMSQDAVATNKPFVARQLKGKQTANVLINGGYSPSVIVVKRGEPVELTFRGGKNIGCGGTVVFESLKISKDVEKGKPTVIRFTPKTKGEIPFTCGMGMLRGTVIVK